MPDFEQIRTEAARAERERIIAFLSTSPDFHLYGNGGICSNGAIRKALQPPQPNTESTHLEGHLGFPCPECR